MALIEINKDPSQRELRLFGLLLLLFFAILAGLLYWQLGSQTLPLYVAGGGAALALVYFAVPLTRRWIYLGWVYAALPIGWTISMLVLAVAYYLVVTPVGLVMRLVGHDPMQRKRDPAAESYWIQRDSTRSVASYFRQF